MEILKPDLIYLLLLLIVPGLLSQIVFNSLVSRGKVENHQWDLYQSLLHTVAIYIIVYPLVVLFLGTEVVNTQTIKSLVTKNRWAPLITVIIIVTSSIAWGIVYSKFYRSKVLKNFLEHFGSSIEPPNVYSRLFSEDGVLYWVRARDGENYIEGKVKWDSTDTSPREVYLKDVIYLDSENRTIRELPENTGVVLDLDKHSLVEITEIPENSEDSED